MKTQSLRFCLALGETWLKDPKLDVSISVEKCSVKFKTSFLVRYSVTGLGYIYFLFPEQEEAQTRGSTFLSKLKLQFQRSATENALIANQLDSPENLKLTGLPARLLMTLYEHSSVEQRYRDSRGETYPGEHAFMK